MDKTNGYVLIFKQIQDNWLWSDKPFARGQAFIDLILMANYADGEIFSKGNIVELHRGQVFRSVKTLADRWGWSVKKTKNFLKILENEKMVSAEGLPQGTRITIENYEAFQTLGIAKGPAEGPAWDQPGTNLGPAWDHKRIKNNKEKKNKEERGAFAPPTLDEVSKYVQEMGYSMDPAAFYDYYSGTGWMRKNGQKVRDWKATVRTWERREKEFGKKEKAGTGRAPIEPPKYKALEPDKDPEKERPERGPITGMPEEMRSKLRPARN